MDQASKMGHRTRKVLLRALLAVLIVVVLHFMYTYREGITCEKEGKCAVGSSVGVQNFGTLPPLVTTAYESSAVKPRYHFRSYDEYLQLQLKKTLNPKLRKLWTSRDWRRKVEVFSLMFQDLMKKGFLKRDDKCLCIAARVGQEVLALKEIGILDAIGIDLVPSPPLVVEGDMHKHPFMNNSFAFEFSNAFDHALFPAVFASEIERTLKPGGYAVIHVALKIRGDKYSANDLESLDGLISLFKNSDVVLVREIDGFGLDTEVVFKKRTSSEGLDFYKGGNSTNLEINTFSGSCLVSELKEKIILEAEPLIQEEPTKPWIVFKQNLKNIRSLPSIVDISGRKNYVYVDVGARNYKSSIGSWFNKQYPSQSHKFSIYAVEPDASFAPDYAKRKNVKLLPYAAWIRDEDLLFGVSQEQAELEGEMGMGRIQHRQLESKEGSQQYRSVKGFDFATWLKQTVSPDDFVVMKMDIEGTEFDLLPRMFETGAICLVDELFLECHYNRWQRFSSERSSKFSKSYGDCLALLNALRKSGVLVHQWW